MKLIFNGVLETRIGGCSACGTKAKTTTKTAKSKSYYLPSGNTKTFIADREVEVADVDGEFLLQYLYTDEHGQKQHVFTKVD